MSTATAKTNTPSQKLASPEVNGPVDHVAFVIHGIGQQTEKFGFFQSHLQSLFDTTNIVVEENSPDQQINVQYIPIEWHKHIHQETDVAMNDITLRSIPSMRMVNNDYLSDAFFYFSKERGQSIINHVTNTFNTEYFNFMKANPGFKGKIVILAYSLGGVITWDILSNQPRSDITKKETQRHSKLEFDFPTLDFKPDYLFNLGSPLSAFLTVRNQDPRVYHPDPSIIFENIFHPYDPLAYRFEPMLDPDHKHTTAIMIDESSNRAASNSLLGSGLISSVKRYFSIATNAITYPLSPEQRQQKQQQQQEQDACMQEPAAQSSTTSTPKLSIDCGTDDDDKEDDSDSYSTPLTTPITIRESGHFVYTKTETVTITSDYTQKKRSSLIIEEEQVSSTKRRRRSADLFVLNTTITRSSKVEIKETLTLLKPRKRDRVDYVLKPELFMGFIPKNEYFSGLTAHFSYWTNKDLMWHIVRRLEEE
ncbi:DDHD domain-containing protein [Parasitella parasitica]|nr:DDHD domain-containing protein [Parasitella parasitica]